MKKNKKEVLVISIMILVLIIGLTYAYFKIVKETIFNMSIYDFDITFNDGSLINDKNLYPIEEEKIATEGIKKEFTMAKKNETDKDVYTKISLVDIELDSAARDKDLRWRLLKNNNILTEGSFVNLGDNNKLDLATNIKLTTTTLDNYTLYIWIQETNYPQRESLMDKSIKARIEVEGMLSEYNVVPNEGKLVDGMIPVVYDEASEQWIKAGGSLGWYDYDNQMWANAVTVYPDHRNEYMESEIGTPINMDDINTMWVWIPRYKYRIPSSIGKSTTTPPEIDVVFETGTEATGVTEKEYRDSFSDCNNDCTNESYYYTHPAFRDGTKVKNEEAYDIGGWDHELTGIWFAKFETGTDNELCNNDTSVINCENVDPIIKPNIKSLSYQNVSTQFITSIKIGNGLLDNESGTVTFNANPSNIYGINLIKNSTNVHMTKNTEWGAMAYLSQSRYGKKGNNNYEGINKEVFYNNSSYIYSGRSSGKNLDTNTVSGTYSYNDHTCNEGETLNCTGEKVENAGRGASSTGSIYGIYDVNGGANDGVMDSYSGLVGSSGFKVMPEQKYYDLYKSADTDKGKTIMGDAMWETKSWYSDLLEFPYSSWKWTVRGNGTRDNPGIFYSQARHGTSDYVSFHISFRTTLIP